MGFMGFMNEHKSCLVVVLSDFGCVALCGRLVSIPAAVAERSQKRQMGPVLDKMVPPSGTHQIFQHPSNTIRSTLKIQQPSVSINKALWQTIQCSAQSYRSRLLLVEQQQNHLRRHSSMSLQSRSQGINFCPISGEGLHHERFQPTCHWKNSVTWYRGRKE